MQSRRGRKLGVLGKLGKSVFPRFSTLSFPFCTIPQTEKLELKTLEICSEVVSSNSEVLWSNSEVLHYTQNGKPRDENLGVFSNAV